MHVYKNTKRQIRYCPKYPNEADRNYVEQKLLNLATGFASGLGLIAAFVFLAAIT